MRQSTTIWLQHGSHVLGELQATSYPENPIIESQYIEAREDVKTGGKATDNCLDDALTIFSTRHVACIGFLSNEHRPGVKVDSMCMWICARIRICVLKRMPRRSLPAGGRGTLNKHML